MDPSFPDVAVDLDGWELTEESVETLFRLPAARVRGATRRYEDDRTRAAVRDATDGAIDHEWRFVALTRVGFEPSLPPGSAPMVLPTVRREARDAFAQRLARRGLEDIQRRGEERIRVGSATRARVTRYGASDPVVDGGVPVAGWIAVWIDAGDFLVVTGGYPDGRLTDLLSVESRCEPLVRTSSEYRDEFVDILRSVE